MATRPTSARRHKRLAPAQARRESTAPARAPTQAAAIADDAYIYGYPLVLMDATCRAMTASPAPSPRGAPLNHFVHMASVPTALQRVVVRPNVDTLYSTAWLDLAREPIVLHVPETHGRYYVLPLLDAWTNVFASIGPRTTGSGAAEFAIVGPGWKGTLPPTVVRIDAPTRLVWLIGRIQLDGGDDAPAVHAIQSRFALTPLRSFLARTPRTPSHPVDLLLAGPTPPEQVEAMGAVAFFTRLAHLMRDNPAPARDVETLRRFALIGLDLVGEHVFDDAAAATLGDVPHRALARVAAGVPRMGALVDGWRMTPPALGRYGTDYDLRALVALGGLGANLPEDAVYPSAFEDADGRALSGEGRYVLRFEPGREPPVDAFWSLTLYDAEGYLVPNALGRHALRDRDRLHRGPDGALELCVQREPPDEPGRRANWLPAPEGAFNLTLRMYRPRAPVLDGTWTPPPLRRRAT